MRRRWQTGRSCLTWINRLVVCVRNVFKIHYTLPYQGKLENSKKNLLPKDHGMNYTSAQIVLIFYYTKKLVMVHLEQGVDMHGLFQKMPTFIFDEVIIHWLLIMTYVNNGRSHQNRFTPSRKVISHRFFGQQYKFHFIFLTL